MHMRVFYCPVGDISVLKLKGVVPILKVKEVD
jgi:hypothetical protein